MPSKSKLSDNKLHEVADHLKKSEVETKIDAEMPAEHADKFISEYERITGQKPPQPKKGGAFYIWKPGTNKYGKELRIYFKDIDTAPPIFKEIQTDKDQWSGKGVCRINHTKLVYQLFECGFLLGKMSDYGPDRIEEYMKKRFPKMQKD